MSVWLGCPEVKLMLIEAAVMELEEALAGTVRENGAARVYLQRIKNLVGELQVDDTATNEWENSYDQ